MTTTHVQQPSLFSYHEEVIPTISDRQAEVLEVLGMNADMTNSELADALDWSINRVTPRIQELREAGKVVCKNRRCPNPAHLNAHTDVLHDDCKRKCWATGRSVFAWCLLATSGT
jgi:hypothetical protein